MNIFVGNLSKQTTSKEIESKFSDFGTVTSVKIIKDMTNGESKGFGFVEMPVPAEANKAIHEMNSFEMGGRKLTVNEARPRTNGGGGGGGARSERSSYSSNKRW